MRDRQTQAMFQTHIESACQGQAVLSGDDRYRLQLSRWWDDRPYVAMRRWIVWVMLNPSTASAVIDDATVLKIIKFSRAWGFDGLKVVNLYAYRATDPDAMMALPPSERIGEGCDKWIENTVRGAERVMLGWGATADHKSVDGRDLYVRILIEQHAKGRVYALKVTRSGQPGHPLYIKDSARPFRMDL